MESPLLLIASRTPLHFMQSCCRLTYVNVRVVMSIYPKQQTCGKRNDIIYEKKWIKFNLTNLSFYKKKKGNSLNATFLRRSLVGEK